MNRRKVLGAVAGLAIAGGLLAGGIGWVNAQTTPDPTTPPGATATPGPGVHTPGSFGAMGTEHTEMLDTVAETLGITPDELEKELQAGKTIPEIAEEKGIDLTELQSSMQTQHAAGGFAGMGMGGHGSMAGGHGQAQETIANALGLTVEELQAELQAGKTVPQIAEEKGVDLTTIHEEMMAGR